MNTWKRWSAVMLLLLLVVTVQGGQAEAPVEIVVETVMLGNPPLDLASVEEAVNRISERETGVRIKLLSVDIMYHERQIRQMITGNAQLDLVMAGLTWPMADMARTGMLMPLDALLCEHGGELQKLFGDRLEAGKIGEALYAIPADLFPAHAGGFVYNRRLADEVGLQIPEKVTLEELEEIFSVVCRKKPGMYGTAFGNGDVCNIVYDLNMETYGNHIGAYGVTFKPWENREIQNLFDTEEFAAYVRRHREWIRKGYALPGTLISGISNEEYMAKEMIFGMMANDSPIERSVQQKKYDFPIGMAQLTDAVISTGGLQERMWGIPVNSRHPEAAMTFLNLLYTNSEVANLLTNGIEGRHYRRIGDQQIAHPEHKNLGYESLFTRFGDQRFLDQWIATESSFEEMLEQFHRQAHVSRSLGYTFDGSSVASELAAVNMIITQYLPALECGMVENVDQAINEMNKLLQENDMERIIEENQRQLDAWFNAKTGQE